MPGSKTNTVNNYAQPELLSGHSQSTVVLINLSCRMGRTFLMFFSPHLAGRWHRPGFDVQYTNAHFTGMLPVSATHV